jgi:hypothetical protein
MKRNIVIGLLAIAVGLAQSTHAKPIKYGCDTPADHFSAIEQNVSLQSFAIKGTIQPNEFRKGKYSPLAQIYLESSDEKYRWAMQVIALDAKAKNAFVVLKMTENGKDSDPLPIGTVKLGEKLIFSANIIDGKSIRFKIGDIDGSPDLPLGLNAKLNIICSTGDFVFDELEWTEK